jgi:hypothetical protein
MAYYTALSPFTIANGTVTWTHSLSITPASLRVRCEINQPQITATVKPHPVLVGTNIILFFNLGTQSICDVEVQEVHSIIK